MEGKKKLEKEKNISLSCPKANIYQFSNNKKEKNGQKITSLPTKKKYTHPSSPQQNTKYHWLIKNTDMMNIISDRNMAFDKPVQQC